MYNKNLFITKLFFFQDKNIKTKNTIITRYKKNTKKKKVKKKIKKLNI